MFVVENSGCGGCLGGGLRGLESWSLGEFWGGIWGSLEVCGAENFEVDGELVLCW